MTQQLLGTLNQVYHKDHRAHICTVYPNVQILLMLAEFILPPPFSVHYFIGLAVWCVCMYVCMCAHACMRVCVCVCVTVCVYVPEVVSAGALPMD